MRRISTLLIDQNILFREGLRKLLARTAFRVGAVSTGIEDLDTSAAPDPEPALVIVGAKDDVLWVERNIRALRVRFVTAKIVVLADEYLPDRVHAAFRASANGYLIKSINFPTLIKSLELVMLGEGVFPSAILKAAIEEADPESDSEDDAVTEETSEEPTVSHSSRSLSAREMQILQCLVRGQSNKMIARNLDIVEATVKVHIKAILRKIRVQNRTQAAIWAVNNSEANMALTQATKLARESNSLQRGRHTMDSCSNHGSDDAAPAP